MLVKADKEAIKHAPSGSFISADALELSIPETLEAIKKSQKPYLNAYINDGKITGFGDLSLRYNEWGMSPDAYRFFTTQSKLPGNVTVYAGKTGRFNDSAVKNKFIYDLESAYREGNISALTYVDRFNEWVKSFGGRPAHIDENGLPFIYHPVIYKKEQGGKLNYINLYKN